MQRAPIKRLPPKRELDRLFTYSPATGVLAWRANPKFNGLAVGKLGTITERGYLAVGICRRYFLAHRIIWKMMTGRDPAAQIDHIDGNRLNNRWANLRLATNGQNIQNSKLRADNKSGVKGICWESSHKAWRATITARGKVVRLGRFKSIQEAADIIQLARASLHGGYARLR